MNKLTTWLLDLLYPTRCILCRRPMRAGRPGICPLCENLLPLTESGGRRKGDFFSGCISAVYYEGAMRRAILRYKFGGAQAYAHALGELTASCVYDNLEEPFDILSWVPLSSDRRRARGYDQTALLAQEVSKRLCRELVPVLKKQRGIRPQSVTGSPERRRANIAGAYRAIDPALIAGKKILLIDDIVTTGSTLSECAKTLLLAGADEVLCATLAETR